MKRFFLITVTVFFHFFLSFIVKAQTNQVVANGGTTAPVIFPATGCVYNWVNNTPGIGLAASGTGDIASFTAVNTTSTPVTATITATPTAVQYAYLSDIDSYNVFVLNTATNSIGGNPIPVGAKPWGEALSPDGSKLYVTNNGGNTVSVINTVTNAVSSTIPVGNAPFGVVVSPDDSKVYVTNANDGTLSVIDVATSGVSTIPLPGALGIAESPDGSKLYVTSSSTTNPVLYVVNTTANYTIAATIPIGLNAAGVAVSPDGTRVYTANGNSNTVSVISTISNTLLTTISGLNTPFAAVVSADGGSLYVTNSGSNTVAVINTTTFSKTSITMPGNPYGISVVPGENLIYVAEQNPSLVSVINTSTNTIKTSINAGLIFIALGNFISPTANCNGSPVTFTITVNPTLSPVIAVSDTLSGLNTVYGSASATQKFYVSGTDMTAGILVTPPTGFEVSTNNSIFNSTVTIGAAGTISSTPVYIRIKSTAVVGTYSGNIVMSSTGASTINAAMPLSTVAPAPLTITADNKSKLYGAINPVLTATYNGFVNNENISQLTTLPLISTVAITTSPPGQYPITVNGAATANYTVNYVSGILTINPLMQTLIIPNTFTPNGDGINDTWDIKNLNTYPNSNVKVFNRYGERVFFSNGYPVPWDGKYKGEDLAVGTYYYVINIGNGNKPVTGFVAIIR